MEVSKRIGERIIAARRNRKLTQAELAERLSICPQSVSMWEKGESIPETKIIFKLAEILEVDRFYFAEKFPTVWCGNPII